MSTKVAVLAGRGFWPSASQLGATLAQRNSSWWVGGFKSHKAAHMRAFESQRPFSLVVGWGFSHPEALNERAYSKLGALRKMSTEGVSIPHLQETVTTETFSFPCYARTNSHTRGEGLWYCEDITQLREAWRQGARHLLQAITAPRTEYRVHVFKVGDEYSVIHRQKKFFANKEILMPSAEQLRVRNYNNGWRFATLEKVKSEVVAEAKKAVEALQLDFGAVDVIRTDEGKVYVLEVNTAPSLSFDVTCNAYCSAVEKLVAQQESEETSDET